MAAYPIPGIASSPLDGPPPSGQVPQPTYSSLNGGGGAPGEMPGQDPTQPAVPQEALQGVLRMGMELDKAIQALASSVPAGAQEFSQARDLLKKGLSKFLASASAGAPPSMTGNSFPGGTGP